MENPIKMDELGYHYFRKHPYGMIGSLRISAISKSFTQAKGVVLMLSKCIVRVGPGSQP